jgi:hypothetical protein
MGVVRCGNGEAVGLVHCKVWCLAGLCSGSLAVENVYMNEFPKIINKLSHTRLFAVDTSIVVTSTNYSELNQKLHSNLHISNVLKQVSWY